MTKGEMFEMEDKRKELKDIATRLNMQLDTLIDKA